MAFPCTMHGAYAEGDQEVIRWLKLVWTLFGSDEAHGLNVVLQDMFQR